MASVDFMVKLVDRASGPAKNIEKAFERVNVVAKAGNGASILGSPAALQKSAASMTGVLSGLGSAAGIVGAGIGASLSMGANIAITAFGALIPVMLSAAEVGASLVASGIAYAAKMAQFKSDTLFAFKYITQTQQGANRLFGEADDLARSMGAKTTAVAASLQELMGGGFDEKTAKRVTAAIADVAAMNPTADITAISKQLAQMKGAGKVTMEDLKPILNAGVNDDAVYAELRRLTGAKDQQALQKLIGAGKVTAEQGTQAILAAISKAGKDAGTDGALGSIAKDKSLNTVAGAFGVLEGNVERLFMAINTGAAGNGMIKMAKSLANLFDPASDSGKKLLAALDKAGELIGKIVERAGKMDFKSIVNAFDPATQSGQRFQSLLDKIGKIFDKITGGGGKDGFTLGDGFELAIVVLNKAADAVLVVADIFETVGPKIKKFFSAIGGGDAAAGAGTVASSLLQLIPGVGPLLAQLDQLDTIRTTIVDKVMSWVDAFYEMDPGAAAIAVFADANSWLADVGPNIVAGLWNGLMGAWSGMLSGFDALVALLPASVRSVLGIASPSKVMMQLGAYTGQGFAAGMAGQEDNVDASMTSLVQPRVSPKVRGAIETARGQDGQGGNGGPSYTFLFGDIVLQKGDEKELASLRERLEQMMREIASNLSPEPAK